MFCKYRTDTIRFKSKYVEGKWYFDWMPAKLQSIGGAKWAFVMKNGSFASVFQAESEKNDQARDYLRKFIDEVGTSRDVKTDNATALVNKNSAFLKLLRKEGISHRFSEPGRSNQMYAINLEIRELKKQYYKKMRESNVPKRLWDYGIKHAARIGYFIPKQRLEGRSSWEAVTGDTPDISEYLDFGFYDLVWYHPHTHPSISTDSGELARWIGGIGCCRLVVAYQCPPLQCNT